MNKKIIRNAAYCLAMVVFVGIILRIGFLQITESKTPKKFKETTVELGGMEKGVSSLNMVLTHIQNMGSVEHSAGTEANVQVKEYITSVLDQLQAPYMVEPFEFDVDAYANDAKKSYEDAMAEYPDMVEENNKFLEENSYKDFIDYVKDVIGLRNESKVIMNNIVVSFDAPNTEHAIVFVTHYDSRPDSTGASSAGLGSAAFLEAIRLMKEQETLTNDIYFLFTDGKEIDLLGAKAFLEAHKELEGNVDVVLNFDAQGTDGTLMLYETSKGDYTIVKQYQQAVSRNSGFSFLADLCKLLPHETDFQVFSDAGFPSMNFSMLEGSYTYNRTADTPEHVNRGCAYEYMHTLNELVDYYGSNHVHVTEKGQGAVFFNFLRDTILVLPSNVVSLVTYLTSMIAIGLLVFFKIRKKIRYRFVARSTIFTIISMILTGIGAAVIIAPSMSKLSNVETKGEWNESQLLFCLVIGVAFVLTGFFTWIAMRRNKHQLSTLMGQLPILLTLGLVMGQEFVSLSYLFTAAMWMVYVAIAVCVFLEKKPQIQKVCYVAMLIVFGVILSILFTPIIYMAYVSLSISVSIIIAFISVIPIALLYVFIITVWKEYISE
ncbi:M28 family metallopeptidase [Anaerosporobacter faecicola]|uniref:M28 family metallopeptidase n=1 Tax=Anaerosporobacter faecicola TaxID=2718714 RepID=UPI00143C5567|nr:M28 family metallopeptidase [Anaerosporobacter faecicola]